MDRSLSSTIEKFRQPVLGIVEETITSEQPGRVKFDGTYWPARFYQTDSESSVQSSELVAVVGIQGITLLVAPLNPEDVPELRETRANESVVVDSKNRLFWGQHLSRRRRGARRF